MLEIPEPVLHRWFDEWIAAGLAPAYDCGDASGCACGADHDGAGWQAATFRRWYLEQNGKHMLAKRIREYQRERGELN